MQPLTIRPQTLRSDPLPSRSRRSDRLGRLGGRRFLAPSARLSILGSVPGMTMVGLGLVVSLAGCRPVSGDPGEGAPIATAAGATSDSSPAEPVGGRADLETMCRDAVSRTFGQEGDSVAFERLGKGRASVSWRAPVDGGKLNFECRANGDSAELSRARSISLNSKQAVASVEQEAR